MANKNRNKVLILISIIIMLLLIGIFNKDSIAAYLGSYDSGLSNIKSKGSTAVGDTVTATYSNLVNRRDLYCVMFHKSLRGNVNYRVSRYISITGNTATNDRGQSFTSTQNGKLAYILSRGEGYGSQNNYTRTQLALYKSINNWYDIVGSKLGISNKWDRNNYAVGGESLISEATNYANNLGNADTSKDTATDKTDKSKITVTSYTDNDTEYLRVGPFNWSFSGKLTAIKVYGDSNKQISSVKYSRFEGSNEKFYDNISDIKSGKNFYISIKANSGFTKIGKISATTQSTSSGNVYSAQIWFLDTVYMQNLILVNTGTDTPKPSTIETPFDYNITLVKDIEIIKIDSIKENKKLDNVGFVLQNKETGKYLKRLGSEYSFVNKRESATEFVTRNGKVTIKGVPIVTYIAYETKNSNKGYEIPEDGTTISVKDKTKKIKNDYKLGKIIIEKSDRKYTGTKLKDVEFTLQATSGKYKGKYVGVNSDGNAYYSKNKIHIKTNDNGIIIINDVWEGSYVLNEENNPTYGYVIDEQNIDVKVVVKPYETTSIKETNDYKLGKVKIEKVDQKYTDKKLKDVEFTLKAVTGRYQGQYVGVDKDGKAYYSNSVVYITTNSNGIIEIDDIWEGSYTLTETKNPNYGYVIDEKNLNIEVQVKSYETSELQVTNEYKLGKISLEKVDLKHHEIKLKNVEFTLKAETGLYAGKYVSIDKDGNALYNDSEVHIKTDDKGRLEIDKVWEGKYRLTEVNNPNYGYIIDEQSQNIEVEVIPYETTERQVENEQVYIRLSGFIWQDLNSGKSKMRNDYYKTDKVYGEDIEYLDDADTAFDGIPVKLKRISDNQIVKEGYSDRKEFSNKEQITTSEERGLYTEIEGGEYVFEYVRVDELSDYYVEFEYDGLIYQSVIEHIDHNNGSKATDRVEREILDRNFTSIDSTGRNEVNVNNGKYIITYNDTVDHATSIKDSSSCILHAKTNDAECYINNYFVPGQSEIRYINLGLYRKPQADLALAQDLETVNVGVNGYWHVYRYGKRKITEETSDSWNVGVKFKSEYSETYRRAIYKSDYEYETEDKNKELQVYLTYRIALNNESSYISRVNSIVDYYDNSYELVAAGTGLDKNNNITGIVNCRDIQNYNNDYQKCIIDVNSTIQPKEANYIFIQFKLDRSDVIQIINNKETLYNRSEINSYTVYKDNNGNTLAAVDIDSVPGNTVIENDNTYEDDADSAPPVLLELNNPRAIQGTVFVDSTSGELQIGKIRQGDGIFNDGEATIEGVKVTLSERNGSISNMETTTDVNGNFRFEGYIPGQYIITYTWGDKTYTVQNYKGTIYDASRKQNDMYWYRGSEHDNDTISVNDRKTDAIDDYNRRLAIDNEVASIDDSTIFNEIEKAYNGEDSKITMTTMDSMTPVMEFSVEYETVETDGTIDKVEFIVKNVDFGIVERARQQLDMTKRVKSFKITLANGQVLADATIDENGKLQGSHDYLTYMGPSVSNGLKFKGYVRAEIDNEIIEGATLDVEYEIKAINNSELDFMSKKYYEYGIQEGDVVTLTPAAVVDYLDKNLGFEPDKNSDWKVITMDELKGLNASKIGDADFLNSRVLLYTDKTAVPLKPTNVVAVELKTSKILTTSKDLLFNNDAETVKVKKPNEVLDNGTNGDLNDDASDDNASVDVYRNTQHIGGIVRYFPIDSAEQIEITPSTGDDRNYIVPVVVGITALIVLGVGVVLVKRKIVD